MGRTAGWIKISGKVSDCCKAKDCKCEPDKGMTNNFYSDIDLCPKCKKPCKFIEASTRTAQYSDSGLPDDTGISQRDDLARKIQNDMYMGILHDIEGMDYNALMELEEKLQVLSSWIVASLPITASVHSEFKKKSQVDQLQPTDGVQNSEGVAQKPKKIRCSVKGCDNVFEVDPSNPHENKCTKCR